MSNSNDTAACFLEELQHRAMVGIGVFPEIQESLWFEQTRRTLGKVDPTEFSRRVRADFDEFERHRQREHERLLADPQLRSQFEKHAPNFRLLTAEELAATAMKLSLPRDQVEAFLRLALPTRYEHPLFYRALLVVKPLVEKAIAALGLNIELAPLVGTLPTGEVHACLMLVPESDRCLVLFNNGWFGYLLRAVPILFRYMSSEQAQMQAHARERVEKLEPNQRAIMGLLPAKEQVKGIAKIDLLQLIYTYLLTGDPSKASYSFNQLAPQHQIAVTSQWLTPIQVFVMGHEYGHLIHRHLDPSSAVTAHLGDEPYTLQRTTWDREFEADATGLQIVSKVLETSPFRHSTGAAVDLFFLIVDLLEKARSVLSSGSASNLLHHDYPPMRQRQERARKQIQASVEPNVASYLEQVYRAFDHMHSSIWGEYEPMFIHSFQSGDRPAELWKRALFHFYSD